MCARKHPATSKYRLSVTVLGLVFLSLFLCEGLAFSQSSNPAYQAGVAPFREDMAGIVIEFDSPMPSSDYTVAVQQANTGGYSPTDKCTYFNVLRKTSDGFQVQHKECQSGTPQAVSMNISLNWIAISETTTATILFREECPFGGRLRFEGKVVGCLYLADIAKGREQELCGQESMTAIKSVGFGVEIPPDLGGPGVIGCLVCIHGDLPSVQPVLDALKPGPYPTGFEPGVSCLGFHTFTASPRG